MKLNLTRFRLILFGFAYHQTRSKRESCDLHDDQTNGFWFGSSKKSFPPVSCLFTFGARAPAQQVAPVSLLKTSDLKYFFLKYFEISPKLNQIDFIDAQPIGFDL